MQINIEIPNLPRVLHALRQAPGETRRGVNRAIRRSVYTVQRTAIPITPIDTGALRRSEETGVSFRDFYGELFPNIEYAYWVHEGTRYMRARPFLSNAVESAHTTIRSIFEEELGEVLARIAKAGD
jgi:hypothetical protein